MTSPRPGDALHLDLGETVIDGRYLEVDPPHRMLIEWDRPATDGATPTPAFIEFTFSPTGDETEVKVQLSGLGAGDAAFYSTLMKRYLNRIAVTVAGVQPGAFPGD